MPDDIAITPGDAPDADLLASLSAKLGMPDAVEPAPPVAGDPPPSDGGDPQKPEETPPATPEPAKPTNKDFAAKRVAEKEATKELERLRARIAELEPLTGQISEKEQSLLELKTVAEQREAELKKYQEKWKDESDPLDVTMLGEIPEVRAAEERLRSIELFPRDISNPHDGEPDTRLDPRAIQKNEALITKALAGWEHEEFNSEADSRLRSDIQHIWISNLAAAIGVDASKFEVKNVKGNEYNVIPTQHPVYQHLKTKVREYVDARRERNAVSERALAGKEQSFQEVVSQRVANTRGMFKQVGLGLTGEELKAASAKAPDSPFLKTMQLLEKDPDLLKELNENIELESTVNGHFRPKLDIAEKDPAVHRQKAETFYNRIGQRALYSPLAPVLMKLSHKQQARIAELEAELSAAREEVEKSLVQAEPGPVSGISSDRKPEEMEPHLAAVAQRLGLG